MLTWKRLNSPLCRGGDRVDDFHDPMKSGVSADGHVCSTEVIIDGAHQAYDV